MEIIGKERLDQKSGQPAVEAEPAPPVTRCPGKIVSQEKKEKERCGDPVLRCILKDEIVRIHGGQVLPVAEGDGPFPVIVMVAHLAQSHTRHRILEGRLGIGLPETQADSIPPAEKIGPGHKDKGHKEKDKDGKECSKRLNRKPSLLMETIMTTPTTTPSMAASLWEKKTEKMKKMISPQSIQGRKRVFFSFFR